MQNGWIDHINKMGRDIYCFMNLQEQTYRIRQMMGLLVEQTDDKSIVLLDGTSSAGKSYLLKQMNAVPYYESNNPNQWVVIASDDFSGTGEEGREGEERRLKLDHPNIRQWAKEKEDAGIVSGIYRENGETVPENPFEKEYVKGTDSRLWYVAQEIKTGPWKKIFVDTVDNQLTNYLPNVNFKQILLHTPIYLLVDNVSKRNEIAKTDPNFKYDSRDIEMVLEQYLEKYEATKERPSENTGDPSTVLTKQGLKGLLSKSTSNKDFIDSFINQLGIMDDGQYYIKVKDNYLSPKTQLINVDSDRTVYLDKFKDIVQNLS